MLPRMRVGVPPAAQTATGRAPSPSVTLTTSHRCAPAVARAVSSVAGRLTGGREIEGTGNDSGSVKDARLAASAAAEAR